MRPLLIDCDPGIDDAVAIALALKSGAFDLVALTAVSGNLTADLCSRNARQVLDLLSAPQVPVSRGPLRPLVRKYPRDPFFHGSDGLAEIELPLTARAEDPRFAADVILEAADRAGGKLEIASLGPLTNLALATIKDPSLPQRIERLTIIGGSFGFQRYGTTRATGDNPASEWNVYVDPEAAQIVFDAGFNLTAIGLDVATHPDLKLSRAFRRTLSGSSSKAAKLLLDVIDFVERRGFGAYCGLIDSLAILHLLDERLFTCDRVRVGVECQSQLSLGQTVVERRENFAWDGLAQINAASDGDYDRIMQRIVATLST